MSEVLAVIGLGYVGFPVAAAFARHRHVVGFDINKQRIADLKAGHDVTGEVYDWPVESLLLTDNPVDLAGASIFIVTVPTPIDSHHNPDLSPLKKACSLIAPHLKQGSLVIFESTVYPGVTRRKCLAWLLEGAPEHIQHGRDFKLGYSPERINPGDINNRLHNTIKIVSGEDEESLQRIGVLYEQVVTVGLHYAPSIEVAEAAKVIENTQRDLNIALMNELSILFDKLNINTYDVLAAAGTKWNFAPFKPGLVGGHCIGVDPYYLTAIAEEVGYHPQVILSGRRINDSMGRYVAQRLIKSLVKQGKSVRHARIGILGMTFKENVADLRNSRVPDIVRELQEYSIQPLLHDPIASKVAMVAEYGLVLSPLQDLHSLDALIIAVAHKEYMDDEFQKQMIHNLSSYAVIADLKNIWQECALPQGIVRWSL